MLTMRDHDVQDYVALRDMDTTDVGMLSEDDRACLDEVGRYLVSTDACRRFAIWLLHKHFEPTPGEVFVERTLDGPPRTETAAVGRLALVAHELSATAICFDPDVSSGVTVIGMEFAAPTDFGSTSPLGADDETALAGLAELLHAHGKTKRFGVRLIRDPLALSAAEVLFETCISSIGHCTAESSNAAAYPPTKPSRRHGGGSPDSMQPGRRCRSTAASSVCHPGTHTVGCTMR